VRDALAVAVAVTRRAVTRATRRWRQAPPEPVEARRRRELLAAVDPLSLSWLAGHQYRDGRSPRS
jgi:hypothetical protein